MLAERIRSVAALSSSTGRRSCVLRLDRTMNTDTVAVPVVVRSTWAWCCGRRGRFGCWRRRRRWLRLSLWPHQAKEEDRKEQRDKPVQLAHLALLKDLIRGPKGDMSRSLSTLCGKASTIFKLRRASTTEAPYQSKHLYFFAIPASP